MWGEDGLLTCSQSACGTGMSRTCSGNWSGCSVKGVVRVER